MLSRVVSCFQFELVACLCIVQIRWEIVDILVLLLILVRMMGIVRCRVLVGEYFLYIVILWRVRSLLGLLCVLIWPIDSRGIHLERLLKNRIVVVLLMGLLGIWFEWQCPCRIHWMRVVCRIGILFVMVCKIELLWGRLWN